MSDVFEFRYCPSCNAEVEGAPEDFAVASKCPDCGERVEFQHQQRNGKKRSFKRGGASAASGPVAGGPVAGTNTASMIETARSQGKPICQLVVGRDEMSSISVVYSEFEKLLKEERLPHVMIVCRNEADADIELLQDDLQIVSGVDEFSMGSQFIRYFLTFLSALFGVGACKLQVSSSIFYPGESRPVLKTFKNKIGIGIMGGSGDGLMKLNQQAIAKGLAKEVVKRLTGRKILTASLRNLAAAALGFGVLGMLIPVIGLVAPCLGIPAWMLLKQRDYKPRQWMAIVGSILGALGGCVWIAVIALNQ